MERQIEKSKLQVMIIASRDDEGNVVEKAINFNKISVDATDENVEAVGEIIGSLQGAEVNGVRRINEVRLDD